MIELFLPGWEHQVASPAEIWTKEYELYEANIEFFLARARSVVRRFARRKAFLSLPALLPTADGTIRSVHIGAIAGVVDRNGRLIRHLPMVPRSMIKAWAFMFREPDHDSHLPLPVVAGRDGWYLAGGPRALLVLEIARARGRSSIPVRTLSVQQLRRCRDTEVSDDCLGAA